MTNSTWIVGEAGQRVLSLSIAVRKWLLILALACLPGLLSAQTPPPATYYVATTGSDSNSGTSPTTPFLTISHALTLCTGGQTVAVASGTYSTVTSTAVIYDNKVRTSMVTVIGWGATQPLISAPAGSNYALWVDGGSFLTFQNFAFTSNNDFKLVSVAWGHAFHTPDAHDVVLKQCDLTDPNTTVVDPGNPAMMIGYGSYNVTVQDCHVHDSGSGIVGPGETAAGTQCNNINILNNTLENFIGDAIQFGAWNNVTIDSNTIENMIDAAGNTFHNDGIQFTGLTQNATITNNYIAHSSGQLMLIQPAVGAIDNVLVENNLVWDTNIGNGGYAIQSQGITHAQFINNTIFASHFGGLLLRTSGSFVPHDTIVANNSLCGYGINNDNPPATTAYEDYNYLPTGVGTGAHDIHGTAPGYVNPTGGNFHPAIGSPLLAAGVSSFTVSGTNYFAPANDLDFIPRHNPPTIGAYETTLGNTAIAYCGFNYATGAVSTQTDGAGDFGWGTSTWTGGTIVSPGLTYSTLPVIANALSYNSNIGTDRVISPSAMPAGYSVVGTDGVTRLGVPGTTVWLSFLIKPTVDNTGVLTTELQLLGSATGGTRKLIIGNINSQTNWGLSDAIQFGGKAVDATGASPATTGQVAFLVVEIQFVTGSGNDVVNLWVNPPINDTPPSTPDATLTGTDIQPFGTLEFKGNRNSISDEVSVGTSWLSVTSGGQP